MKLYVEVYFSASGIDPMEVIRKIKDAGFEPVVGEYDFVIEYGSPEEYGKAVDRLTRALRGSEATFRLITRKE
ncbi:MAG: hypothetical protein ACLFVL_06790 [Candidatus Aenigmatarchaeota archaeon]